MELAEIIRQPEGFTPPEVTVKIERVYDYKAGTSGDGKPWSFQDVQVPGGRLKLKGLMREFPKSREGQTVTLRAKHSAQHGLTGMKVAHEEYQGKTYDKLIVTPSCQWVWANGTEGGHSATQAPPAAPTLRYTPDSGQPDVAAYTDHLMSCAAITNRITSALGTAEPTAIQACFATVVIDTKNRGVMLPKDLPTSPIDGEPEAVRPGYELPHSVAGAMPEENPFDDGGDPPF